MTLFALVEYTRNFTLCGRYQNCFEEYVYRAYLSRSNSFTVVKLDKYFLIGVFNDLDCKNSLKIYAKNYQPACIRSALKQSER